MKEEHKKQPVECEAMIDIETLDTENTAVMFQFAIVLFDSEYTTLYEREIDLSVQEQINAGRTISESTLRFHMGLPANLRDSLNAEVQQDLLFFTRFLHTNQFFRDFNITNWWSKGQFDFDIIENIYASKEYPKSAPWMFFQKRELRTLMKECNVSKGLVSHNALEDCHAQIQQLAQCRQRINA